MINTRLKPGRKKQRKQLGGYVSAYIKPAGKYYKRLAARKVRRSKNISNGSSYKKLWGPFEWE